MSDSKLIVSSEEQFTKVLRSTFPKQQRDKMAWLHWVGGELKLGWFKSKVVPED